MRVLFAGALAALIAWPGAMSAHAQESKVKGWNGLNGRETAVFRAKVVDVLCELTGECAEKCGAGHRQMGLVREDDGRLILAAKNAQAQFQGATADLYPYCGQTVTVDGLMVGPDGRTKFFQVHFIQREGSDKWAAAKRWSRIWKREYPQAASKKGRWYRNDPRILKALEADGYLGLGADADKAFIEENE